MVGAVPVWTASMPQAWMDRIVSYVAEEEGITFQQAKRVMVERMEERALSAERQGLSSLPMWQSYAKMALLARNPRAKKQGRKQSEGQARRA